MKLKFKGQNYEFPDDSSVEEINEFFGNSSSGGQKGSADSNYEDIKNKFNYPVSSIKNVNDFLTPPSMRNILSGLGEAGQNIGDRAVGMFTKNPIPHINIADTFGAGNSISDKIQQGVGQYVIPSLALGSIRVPLGMASNMLGKAGRAGDIASKVISRGAPQAGFMGTQTDNPLTGIAAGFGGQALAELAPYAVPFAKRAFQSGKNAINYFRPAEESRRFIHGLGGGATSEANSERIANTINTSAEMKKMDALQHKDIVMQQVGKKRIDNVPDYKLPEGNLDKVAKVFGWDVKDITEDQATALSKALNLYRKNGDFDSFVEAGEDIFNSKGISPQKEEKISEMLEVPTKRDLKYFSPENAKNIINYDANVREIHDIFDKNPTFENAHKLESQIDTAKRLLSQLSKKGKLDQAGSNYYQSLIRSSKALKEDMRTILDDMPEDIKKEWGLFKDKYRNNYAPYESTTTLAKIAKGQTEGVKPGEIRKEFSYPKAPVKKILKDLPQEGRNYILYNELTALDPNNAPKVVEFLDKLEQSEGYAKYITPEMKAAKELIKKKMKAKNTLINVGTLGTAPVLKKGLALIKLALKDE